ncbi:MAG: VOC family protein [Rhodospirillaceae bacterium]|nr:VOC family protein [Rhodospirillaceae bacterium]
MRVALAFIALLSAGPTAAQDPVVSSTYLRTAIFTADRAGTVKFYKDVLGYEELTTNELAAPEAGNGLGVPAGAKRVLTGMKSKDGAGLSIMSVEHPDMKPLARPAQAANAWGDVMLVHQVSNIAEIHRRAVAGGHEVLMAPRPSASGRSLQMLMRDPNGVRLELYEMLPEKK